MKTINLLAVTAAVLLAQPAFADDRGQMSNRDFKFLKAAMKGGKMEVMLGQIAVQNAQDSRVRDFGQKMVQDHQAANQKLMDLAARKGVSISDEPGWWDRQMMNHLQKTRGEKFDASYMKAMVKDHEKDVKEFQKEADQGEDADVRNFAGDTLPTLQEHWNMAREIRDSQDDRKDRSRY